MTEIEIEFVKEVNEFIAQLDKLHSEHNKKRNESLKKTDYYIHRLSEWLAEVDPTTLEGESLHEHLCALIAKLEHYRCN